MTSAQKTRSLRRLSAMSAMLCLGGLSSTAMAGTRGGVDVAVSGKVSTNPFNASNPGAAVVAISPSVAPWLTYEDPNTTVELHGSVLVDQYTRVYGRNTNGSVQLDAKQVVSQTFTVRGGVDYFDANVGLHDFLLARATAADAVSPPGTPLPDVTTAGLRTRTQTLSGRLGGDLKLSGRDSISLNFSGALTQSDASSTSDFVSQTVYGSYHRQLNARTSASLSVQATNVDYLKTDQGDGTIISPQLGINRQFSDKLSVGVNLGASFASFKSFGGLTNSFTVLSGSVRICDTLKDGEFCLNAGRTAQPTALGGIAASSDVSVGLDRRFGRKDTLSLTARYSRVEQNNERFGLTQDFVGAMVTYTRKFSERFSAFVTPSYSKTFDNIATREGNFEMRVGLRCRFGAIQ